MAFETLKTIDSEYWSNAVDLTYEILPQIPLPTDFGVDPI